MLQYAMKIELRSFIWSNGPNSRITAGRLIIASDGVVVAARDVKPIVCELSGIPARWQQL